MQMDKKSMSLKTLLVVGGLFLSFKGAEAEPCSFNLKSLQEALATFCSGERFCCNRSFYANEEDVALNFIAQAHRQCSRENHPDKNPNLDAEDKMKQCNGGREVLEAHFSCLREDVTYRSWFLSSWPVELYLRECRSAWGKPLTEAELQQKKERIQTVFHRARAGDYGL